MPICYRLGKVHPDAPHPELWEPRRPTPCKAHAFNKRDKNKARIDEHMKSLKTVKRNLDMKIQKIKSKKDKSQKEINKAIKKLEKTMKSLDKPEDIGCKPPSLYLPEFGKEFTDEPCPYAKES